MSYFYSKEPLKMNNDLLPHQIRNKTSIFNFFGLGKRMGVLLLLLSLAFNSYSQDCGGAIAPGTYTFSGIGTGAIEWAASPGTATWVPCASVNLQGFKFTTIINGGTARIVTGVQGGTNHILSFIRGGSTGTVTTAIIESEDGSNFGFTSFKFGNLQVGTSNGIQIEGFRDGSVTAVATHTVSTGSSGLIWTDVTLPASFGNVDKIVITGFAMTGIRVDDIVISAAVASTPAPTITFKTGSCDIGWGTNYTADKVATDVTGRNTYEGTYLKIQWDSGVQKWILSVSDGGERFTLYSNNLSSIKNGGKKVVNHRRNVYI